ncbi:MAG: biliverdin-producing heme oxygenase [Planctomycetota bacterium]|nr:biliverdin-producing heme oxygenase [Planctomycetota bacterium]
MHQQPPVAADASVMDRLKAQTDEILRRGQQHPLQRVLVAGQISREQYVGYIRQLLLIHQPMERLLRTLRDRDRAASLIIREEQFLSPRILQDLTFLGSDGGAMAGRAVRRCVDEMHLAAARVPRSTLGFLYVVEGSKNGARYVAPSVQRALNLLPGPGTSMFDPNGDEQFNKWMFFKNAMNTTPFSAEEVEAMIHGGRTMFEAFIAVSEEIMPTRA